MSRKAAVEAIGTFFLVLTVGQVVIEPGAGALAPLATGAVLMVMVYAGGPISGAHFNPAVTLGVLLRGKASGRDLIAYWAAQLAGGILAALCVRVLKGGAPVPALELAVGPALLAELLFTFALVFVILNVATTRAPRETRTSGWPLALRSWRARMQWDRSPAAYSIPPWR